MTACREVDWFIKPAVDQMSPEVSDFLGSAP